MDVPGRSEPLSITDATINIAADLNSKVNIVQKAIDLAHAIGTREVRVALLSALETVTAKVPSTIEVAALRKMAGRGQIRGALVDGPLALDNAISSQAAVIKKLAPLVAGRANLLVVSDLEPGNLLAKSLSFLAKADAAGIALGARVPIILTSSRRLAHKPSSILCCCGRGGEAQSGCRFVWLWARLSCCRRAKVPKLSSESGMS